MLAGGGGRGPGCVVGLGADDAGWGLHGGRLGEGAWIGQGIISLNRKKFCAEALADEGRGGRRW
jgi:hypothetical protein